MMRGDVPHRMIAVSLDDSPGLRHDRRMPKVVLGDDPLSFEPATAACRSIGLFAEPVRPPAISEADLKPYPRIEVSGASNGFAGTDRHTVGGKS